VLLGLSGALTLLGGIGSSCVAFGAEKFGASMAGLIAVKPVLKVLVAVSIITGVFGIVSIARFSRRRPRSAAAILVFLLVGLAASAVQFYLSLTRRGSTAPNDMRLYVTALTLLAFAIARLPGPRKFLWGGDANGAKARGSSQGSGAAFLIVGFLTITAPSWCAPTHVLGGSNTAAAFGFTLALAGAAMALGGVFILVAPRRREETGSREGAGIVVEAN